MCLADNLCRVHRDLLDQKIVRVDKYRPRSTPPSHSSFRLDRGSICRIGSSANSFPEGTPQLLPFPGIPLRAPAARVGASPFLSDRQIQVDTPPCQQPTGWQPRRRIRRGRVEHRGSRPPQLHRSQCRRDNTCPGHRHRDGAWCHSGRDPKSLCHSDNKIRQGTEDWGSRDRVCCKPIRAGKLRDRSFHSWDSNTLVDTRSTPPGQLEMYTLLAYKALASSIQQGNSFRWDRDSARREHNRVPSGSLQYLLGWTILPGNTWSPNKVAVSSSVPATFRSLPRRGHNTLRLGRAPAAEG
mmetsp:Transcript_5066/g.14378  ORF Transcript_5066/g.14378 Transcript_5066/m.14378 type:complete len:297 (-) Transcript_5066:1406-2296(-)